MNINKTMEYRNELLRAELTGEEYTTGAAAVALLRARYEVTTGETEEEIISKLADLFIEELTQDYVFIEEPYYFKNALKQAARLGGILEKAKATAEAAALKSSN